MKKELLLAFLVCSLTLLQQTANASSNGTIVNGYYIIEDFDGTAPTFSTTGSNCVIETYPVEGRGQSVKLSVTSNNGYFTIPVTLPTGINLSDNDSLLIDLYHLSGTFKRLRVHLGSTHANSSSVAYDYGGNFLGGTVPINKGTVRVGINQLTGHATAGNSFRLGFGIDYGTTVVYIDNIKLKYTLSTAPTVSDADNVNATSFTANWQALFGVENYRLDVATDEAFTSMVSGYNNLNVGNVTSYEVTGLDENVTYYYRVRGQKTNNTSPSSSTISVITQAAGPVDPYVAPNFDPTEYVEPAAPSATSGSFIIADFEFFNIDDPLTVNNTDRASATIKANPTNGSEKSAYIRITEWDRYLRLNVQLPEGKVMSDYTTLSFDEYLDNGYDHNYKDIRVNINNVQAYSVASGQVTYAAWTTRSFTLTGNSQVNSAGNSFTLDLGMRTANGSFYIDNIRLIGGDPAPTAQAATLPVSNGFRANWRPYVGSTSYRLDVATNSNFSNIVSGYNDLNVGDTHTYTVTGLDPSTNYFYRVRGVSGQGTTPSSNTISVSTRPNTASNDHFATRASGNITDIATWQSSTNNAAWMNATAAPGEDARSIRVLKDHELTVDDDFSATEIIVRAGAKLNIASGKQLSLTGRIFLESNEADGTATLVNDGTISVGDEAIVKQYLASGRNWYFASPVSNATSAVIKETSGNQLWQRNVSENSWLPEITATDVPLTPGRGYIAKLNASDVITFNGTLNNGLVEYPISSYGVTSGKFHLVGNPYPSYLDWQSVVTLNPGVMPTLWFRTLNDEDTYIFATVLIAGETAIVTAPDANTDVTKYVPPMQAFWVRIKDDVESTNFTVNNTMRDHADVSGNRFKAPAAITQLLRLEVSNGTNKDEAVLYFNANASDSFDSFDAPKMFNNNAAIPEIYTCAGNERLVINGMSEYNFNTMIPVGFITNRAGNFSIRASQLQNFDNDTRIVLRDNATNTEFELTQGEAYTFSADVTNSEDRFAVLFRSASGATDAGELNVNTMYAYSNHGRLTLHMNTSLDNAHVTVFNVAGQTIYSQPLNTQITQLDRNLDAGVYLLKVENAGKTVVLRTIIH